MRTVRAMGAVGIIPILPMPLITPISRWDELLAGPELVGPPAAEEVQPSLDEGVLAVGQDDGPEPLADLGGKDALAGGLDRDFDDVVGMGQAPLDVPAGLFEHRLAICFPVCLLGRRSHAAPRAAGNILHPIGVGV